MKRIYLTRDLTKEEVPWLPFNILKSGTILYEVDDWANLCTPQGVAVSSNEKGEPYWECPQDAVKETFHQNFFGRN